MLKNKVYKIFYYCLFLVSIIGCDSYLSELPDNRTIIDSPEKVSALITGAYSNANYMLMAELMSDNVEHKNNTNGEQQLDTEMYYWEDSSLEGQDSPNFFWEGSYKAIAQANEALAAIKTLGETNLKAQKGEALLARAYAHFMLVNFWAKHYNANTANSDLGIPYVLEPETTLIKEYKRNTVQEVYDLIEKDLKEGLSLVQNNYKQPKFHFTKEAGYAFAARFYTYKGDWDNVIKYASKVISNPSNSNEIRNDLGYRSLTYDQTLNIYSNYTENTNLLVSSTSSWWARRFAGSRYGLSADKATELFFGGAGNPFRKSWAYRVFGNDNVYNLPKINEYFKITNQSAGTGFGFVQIILFDKDEILLNRAEAYAMKEDYASSLNDLNVFIANKTRSHDPSTDILDEALIETRYPSISDEFTPFYSLNNKQTSFIKAIAEFKRRDYYHEGLRWFDVKRFALKIEHKVQDEATLVLEKNDNRKLLQIPGIAIARGITPNPR
ncbi:starch-binding outer membrane protein, SusD/RagB family [Tenacibaculum sp. 190524A02b]|uniref:Starch-binding outer membrane protein, SusD/RagB family n=1 Tax=Tenacibaculum vairaonense TaxID=3137860 RepID=A0ABM9PJH6_9FLAO